MRGRIGELDSWRAISIGLVLIGHLLHYALLPAGGTPTDTRWPWLPELDVFGVRLFFCISGYIITRLALDERTRTGGFSIGRFWVRRSFRILPALAVYLAVVAMLQADGRIVQGWGQTARGALFVCNLPGLSDCGWFTGHLWSLAVEEQFYLLFPLLFARLAPARFARVVAVGWLLLAAFPLLAGLIGHGGRGLFASPFTFLLAGVLLALHERTIRTRLRRVARPAGWAALAVVATSLLASTGLWPGPSGLLQPVLWFALPPALCVSIALTLDHPGWLGRTMRSAPLQSIGRMSYSLYLWQQLWLGWPDLYAGGTWLPSLALLALVAWASWRWIETPLARRGARWAAPTPAGT